MTLQIQKKVLIRKKALIGKTEKEHTHCNQKFLNETVQPKGFSKLICFVCNFKYSA